MIRVGILSDTHSWLDPALLPVLQECDEIWHAGDVGNLKVLESLQQLHKELKVVYGNIDGHEVRLQSAHHLIWQAGSKKILMLHIGGYPGHYAKGIKAMLQAEKPDILVCGHSHILRVMYDKDLQLLYINPGACGREGFHQVRTMIRLSIDGDQIKDLEVIELGKRG